MLYVQYVFWGLYRLNTTLTAEHGVSLGHSTHVTHLALGVSLDLPAPRQLQLSVCELVEENNQVSVVLVALKVPGIAPHLQDHVFDTAAAGEHPVGCLETQQPQRSEYSTAVFWLWICEHVSQRV